MNSPASPGQTTTPGPWHIGKAHTDDEGYVELPIHAMVNGKLATSAAVCLQFPYMPGMQDANARLIAAAPDLLDAAKLGLSIAKSWIDQEMTGTAHTEAMWALGPIRAAIARASGEKT